MMLKKTSTDPSLSAEKTPRPPWLLGWRGAQQFVTSTKWPISWTKILPWPTLGGEGAGNTGPDQAQPRGKSNYAHRCKKNWEGVG